MAFIGPGQLLGEEDVVSNLQAYTTSVVCLSDHAEMYCIKADEFVRRLKSNVESWKTVILMALAKQQAIIEKIRRVRGIISVKEETQTKQPLINE